MARPADLRATSGPDRSAAPPRGKAQVRALPFGGDDTALILGLRQRDPAAVAAFCDRYSSHVKRVLARVLGADDAIPDLHHDVFLRALRAVGGVRDPSRLKGWITIVAVNVARNELKRRYRQRWLRFAPPELLPETAAHEPSDEHTEALRRTYALLDELPREQRIAFALRVIDGMKLDEVAAAAGVSLATIKRRLDRAQQQFAKLARADEVLAPWIEGGERWTSR